MFRSSSALQDNLGLKLIALILAILLEIYFFSPENAVTVTVPIRIEVKNVQPGKMVVEPQRRVVQVKLRGPSFFLDAVQSSNETFTVDLNGVDRAYTAQLTGDQLNLPRAVEVLDVIPRQVTFILEELVTKELEVVVDLAGDPPAGYRLAELRVDPAKVVAMGPASELSGVSIISTHKVNMTNVLTSRRLPLSLVVPGVLTKLDVRLVSAYLDVRPIEAVRTFEGMSVRVLAPHGFAATVQPSKVRVVVTGPEKVLGAVKEKDLTLIADGRAFQEGSYAVKLGGELPPGVEIVETVPEKVSINLVTTNGQAIRH